MDRIAVQLEKRRCERRPNQRLWEVEVLSLPLAARMNGSSEVRRLHLNKILRTSLQDEAELLDWIC